jgi:glycosyltransferase involved in cell wall biosynthesis
LKVRILDQPNIVTEGGIELRVLLVVPSLNLLQFKGLARVSVELVKGLHKYVDLEVVEVHKPRNNHFKNLSSIPLKEVTSKADICHAVVPESGAIAFLKRRRMVTTFHDITPLKLSEQLDYRNKYFLKMYVLLLWNLAARSETVVCDSSQTASEVQTLFNCHPITVNLGVDKKFRPIQRKKEKPTLGFFANFAYRKRVNIAIEVFKNVKRNIDCKLIIAGGNLESMFQNNFNVKKMLKGVSDVEVLGYVPEEKIVQLYNSFDFFLFPSLSEGFGLPILEAQKCGVPVLIKGDATIPREVKKETIECDSADEMAATILYLLNNKGEYNQVSMNGQSYASQFTWEKFIKQHLAIYERLVSYHT